MTGAAEPAASRWPDPDSAGADRRACSTRVRRAGPSWACGQTGVMRIRSRRASPVAALLRPGAHGVQHARRPPAPAPPPPPPRAGAGPDPGLPGRLVAEVTGDGVFAHLQELQRIADANAGNRALGTPGYDASVEYVAGVLRAAGYQVQTPEFAARRFSVQDQRLTVDGAAGARARPGLLPRHPGRRRSPRRWPWWTREGCDAAALAGVPAGSVLLLRRGTCTFAQKSARGQDRRRGRAAGGEQRGRAAGRRHPGRRRHRDRAHRGRQQGRRRPAVRPGRGAGVAGAGHLGRGDPQPQRDRPDQHRQPRPGGVRRRAPGLGGRGAGDQRQRLGNGGAAGDGGAAGRRGTGGQRGAVRVLGRRGGGADRLHRLRGGAGRRRPPARSRCT